MRSKDEFVQNRNFVCYAWTGILKAKPTPKFFVDEETSMAAESTIFEAFWLTWAGFRRLAKAEDMADSC